MDERIEIIDKIYKGARINIIGDSIAAGIGSSQSTESKEIIFSEENHDFMRRVSPNSWWGIFDEYLSKNFPGCSIINNGCDGATSTQILCHLNDILNDNDDIIFLMLGCNDRKIKNGMDMLYKNTKKIIDTIRWKEKNIVIFTPTPSTNENENFENRLYHTPEVVNKLRIAAEEKKVMVIDNYNYIQQYLLSNSKNIEDIIYCEGGINDGFHPGDLIQQLMYKNLMKSLGLKI